MKIPSPPPVLIPVIEPVAPLKVTKGTTPIPGTSPNPPKGIEGATPNRLIRGLFDPEIHRRIINNQTSPLLQTALNSVDKQKIRDDVYHLTSPELEGRGTPSAGQDLAAKYLIERLIKQGWSSGSKNGDYLYPYHLSRAHFNHSDNFLTITAGDSSEKLKLGEDYYYSSLSQKHDLEITADMVFIDKGDMDSYSTQNVKDKWVILYDSSIPPHQRRQRALDAEAKGLIILPDPDLDDLRYNQKIDSLIKMSKEPLPYGNAHDIDEVFLSRKSAARLFHFITSEVDFKNIKNLTHAQSTANAPIINVEGKKTVSVETELTIAKNVVGFYEGSDPNLKDEVILITAHYDHLGIRQGIMYPGADDNASGSSALLALTKAIPHLAMGRSVMIMWVSGEELGLLGSDAWARNPDLPEGKHAIANINVDMVGRNDTNEILITPSVGSNIFNGLGRRLVKHADKEGFTIVRSADKYWRRSDQYSFYQHLKIPVAFVTNDTHADYHKSTDTPDKINYDKITNMTRLILRVLDDMREVKLDL